MEPTTADSNISSDAKSFERGNSKRPDVVPPRFAQNSAQSHQVDPELVKETKKQISALIQEIAELAQTEIELEDFYDGFLTKTTSALASVGGAIWTVEKQGQLRLSKHINLSATGLPDSPESRLKHTRLLQRLAETAEPSIVGPQSSGEEVDHPGNPTDQLLVICPLKIDREVVGLVEVFQRSGTGPTTQRGYLRFLVQMCDIASDFLKNRQIRDFYSKQSLWTELESFIRACHIGLNPKKTAFTIANEGRRLIECDRSSVALINSGRGEIVAVSGLDSIERRASQIKLLNQLVLTAVKTGEPFWYFGKEEDLPPQIEKKLHEYLDDSHAKIIGIEPLFTNQVETANTEDTGLAQPKTLIGALIVEQLKDDHVSHQMVEKSKVVALHGSDALSNAIEHDSVFLMPLWQRLGKLTWLIQARRLPKTLTVFCILLTIVFAAFMVPYPFTLGANGELTPLDRVEIFAQVDGVLQEITVPASPDDPVTAGQLVARMTSNELSVEINNLHGQLRQNEEKLNKLNKARNSRNSVEENWEIDGQFSEALALRESLQNQIALKEEQLNKLNIYAPMDGYVVDWQLREKLLRRPINRGQHLMTIVAPDSKWLVEFEVPEKRVGHLIKAQAGSDQPITVTFTMASQPGNQYIGKVIEIQRRLDVRSDEGNSALVKVAFDSSQIDPELLRTGTRIRGKFNCGNRSFGAVWLHDVIETVQSSVLFWF